MTPTILYWAIVALGVAAVLQLLSLGNKAIPAPARAPLIAAVALVVLENIYYGAGRSWPGLYIELALYLPAVLTFKVGYIIALADLNVRLAKGSQ